MLDGLILLLNAVAEHVDDPAIDRAIVQAEALADVTLTGDALHVAACESGHRNADGTATPGTHDWQAKNPYSSASGAFQFIDSTWEWVTGLQPPARHHPPHIQLAAFELLWDGRRGAHHWQPSRHCWAGAL